VNSEDKNFLDELEARLEENRQMAERSWVPKPLWGAASYLGFHSFRVLVIVSLLITVGLFLFWHPVLIEVSKQLFLYI
jgi:hypothetical protein